MKRNLLTLTLFLAVCLLSSNLPLSAQELSDEMVQEAAVPLIENKVVDGISIGYIQGDKQGTIHLGRSGTKDAPADNSTLYEIGSISKVFTSLLLADAVVRDKIELNDDANIENSSGIEFPSRDGQSISWLDLSTHRSGLPRLPSNMDATTLTNPYALYDSKKAAEALAELELTRSPSESHEYSNFAVSVLGYLIGEQAGMSYEELLQQRIAKPLGMSDCTVSPSDKQKARHSTPHKSVGSPTPAWTFADLPGAGGVRASMKDMMRFAKAQLNPPEGKLGEAIELAWKQHAAADDSGGLAMGLGWIIMNDGETHWHNGQTGGSHSMLMLNRKKQTAVILLSNTAANIDSLAFQLMVPPKPAVPQSGPDAPAIDAELRARLVGRYELAPNFIFDVKDQDGRLMVGITNQPTQEVFPDSATHWSYKSVNATLEFKLPKEGAAKSLVLHQNGLSQTAKRMEEKAAADKKNAKAGPAIDAEHRARLVGRYKLTPNFIFDVKDRDGRLMVGITNQPTQEVFPDSATHWSYKGVKATLEFKLRKKGAAKSLVLHQNGIKQTAKRMGK